MKYAIIADIHANLEAWLAVKAELEKEKPDQIICLGDIVGYGADPRQCLKEAEAVCGKIIAGNHDWAVCGKFDVNYFNSYAREAVKWTEDVIDENHKNYLAKLPIMLDIADFTCVHGSLYHPEEFNYILNLDAAAMTFANLKKHICFIGHSHSPAIIVNNTKDDIDYVDSEVIEILDENKYIINVGSIGQPRDGNPKSSYCIYDTQQRMIEIKRVAYEVHLAQKKIIEAGLPHFLATRLAGGR
jgi:predicted phosphodiesterase